MRVSLAQRRESSNFTQIHVSQCVGISQGYYSDIESGVRCPSPVVAMRIAKVLEIPKSDMFEIFYSDEKNRGEEK